MHAQSQRFSFMELNIIIQKRWLKLKATLVFIAASSTLHLSACWKGPAAWTTRSTPAHIRIYSYNIHNRFQFIRTTVIGSECNFTLQRRFQRIHVVDVDTSEFWIAAKFCCESFTFLPATRVTNLLLLELELLVIAILETHVHCYSPVSAGDEDLKIGT